MTDQLVLGRGGSADLVDDVQEVDAVLGVGAHPLPRDSGSEMNRLTLVVTDHRSVRAARQGRRRGDGGVACRGVTCIDDLGCRRRGGNGGRRSAPPGAIPVRLLLEEQLVERHVELVDDGVERADRGRGAAQLDLRDQAG
jgi:hypothetical protein